MENNTSACVSQNRFAVTQGQVTKLYFYIILHYTGKAIHDNSVLQYVALRLRYVFILCLSKSDDRVSV